MTYKYSTVDWGYCKDSTALLADLLDRAGSHKTFVEYNKNHFVLPDPTTKRFALIVIERRLNTYYGFLNFYKSVN